MKVPSPRRVEETLISDVLGWDVVTDPNEAADPPAAYWSPSRGCFNVIRPERQEPEPFAPTRSFRDVWRISEELSRENGFSPRLARPVSRGNVRVVVDLGRREVVAEARSLPQALSMAIYQAAVEQLV